MASRTLKRVVGGVITALGGGLCIAFILSGAWFGVAFGMFIGLFGVLALVYPDDAFRSTAKELTTRDGSPNPRDPE